MLEVLEIEIEFVNSVIDRTYYEIELPFSPLFNFQKMYRPEM